MHLPKRTAITLSVTALTAALIVVPAVSASAATTVEVQTISGDAVKITQHTQGPTGGVIVGTGTPGARLMIIAPNDEVISNDLIDATGNWGTHITNIPTGPATYTAMQISTTGTTKATVTFN